MDCKATFTKPRRTVSGRPLAFSLVEMLVGISVASLALAVLATAVTYTGRSFANIANYSDLERLGRTAIDKLALDIRGSVALTSFSSTSYDNPQYTTATIIINSLTFQSDTNGNTLEYTFDPTARTVTRTYNGTDTVFLQNCDYLNFYIYQRNQSNGTFNPIPTTSAALCKLVKVEWACSRNVLGIQKQTEALQSAKIVLRQQ